MYSYILGRPQMTVRDSHDVAMPLPTNTDGTRNAFDLYQTALIQLSNLAGEAMEKVAARSELSAISRSNSSPTVFQHP